MIVLGASPGECRAHVVQLERVVLLLAAVVLAYVALGLLQRHRRSSIGLSDSIVLAADHSRIGSPMLRSERLRLVGRPDQLIRIGGQIIPVEQKPRATRVHNSHVMQVAAECLLVSDAYGMRPPYGYSCSPTEYSTAFRSLASSSNGFSRRSLE